MGSETDKLFRDKLKGFEQTPPPSAWSRVEKGVRKSRGFRPWLNIAAALLILILGIWNKWPDAAEDQILQDVTDTIDVNQGPLLHLSEIEIAETTPIVSQENNLQQAPALKKQQEKPQSFQVKSSQPIISVTAGELKEAVVIAKEDSGFQQQVAVESTVVQHAPQINGGSTTILISADEVNSRFLKKPKTKKSNSISPASIPETKQNAGQKLSSIAAAIKHNEVGLGDLRQIKDELLAFDFRDNDHKNTHTQDK